MNILTVYSKDASKLLSALDSIALKLDVKVLAADPERLYNDVNTASITLQTDANHAEMVAVVNSYDVFVCEEDPADWK